MAPDNNNWLSFSLSSMEMLNSTSSHHHHHHQSNNNNNNNSSMLHHHHQSNMKFDLASSSADSHQYYFADNFFPHGWSNPKPQVMYSEAEKEVIGLNINTDSSIFQNFVEHPPPKLEDFLGGDSSSLTQDSSSLTHIYENPNGSAATAVYNNYNEHQDFKNITGFQAFSTNSGSEVDNSVGTEFGTNESCNELGYSQCVAAVAPPLLPTGGGGGALSLAVNAATTTTNQCSENEKAIVAVADSQSCKKISDTFGQRTSIYRGVTRHRWTGRYEAHLWDNSCRREGQARKGRQVYLGGYDKEDKAARAYDLAALKYWGPTATTNFPVTNYTKELEEMKHMTKQEFIASLRRKSSGFSRGASIYRGVTRHHQQGRWQARIGRVAGNKDLYLGTFATEEEAAEAYDIAAIKFRGVNAVTNFEMNRYDVEAIMQSSLPVGGTAKRLKLSLESEQKSSSSNNNNHQQQQLTQCNSTNNINFGAMPPVSAIPCGVPFDNTTPAFYHHNFFQYLHPGNASVPDVSNATTTMAAAMPLLPSAADLFIWPHQSY